MTDYIANCFNILCDVLGTTQEDVRQVYKLSRKRELVEKRAIISHYLRAEGMTLFQLRDLFGLQNHTSIMYYAITYEALQFNEKEYIIQIDKAYKTAKSLSDDGHPYYSREGLADSLEMILEYINEGKIYEAKLELMPLVLRIKAENKRISA